MFSCPANKPWIDDPESLPAPFSDFLKKAMQIVADTDDAKLLQSLTAQICFQEAIKRKAGCGCKRIRKNRGVEMLNYYWELYAH